MQTFQVLEVEEKNPRQKCGNIGRNEEPRNELTWMDLEGIMFSEIRQREANAVSLLCGI